MLFPLVFSPTFPLVRPKDRSLPSGVARALPLVRRYAEDNGITDRKPRSRWWLEVSTNEI